KSSKSQSTPLQANMLSRLPLQQLPLVPNEGLEIQEIQVTQKEIQEVQETQRVTQEIQATQKEFLQGNLFMNSNITFHIHNHYY
ncbi:16954_t:CDS:1, partial [Cetraspora pellucida]